MTYQTSKYLRYTAILPILYMLFNYMCNYYYRTSDTAMIITGIFATAYFVIVVWLESYYRNRCTMKMVAHLEYVKTFRTRDYTKRISASLISEGVVVSKTRINKWFARYEYVIDGVSYKFAKRYYSNKLMYSYYKYPQIFSKDMAVLTEPVELLTIMVDPKNPRSYYELPAIYQKNNQYDHDDDDLIIPELFDY